MKNLLAFVFISLLITSCVKYEVRDEGVYYITWNEGSGKYEKFVPDADQESFSSLKKTGYGKDNKHVFYEGEIIPGADPKTFEFVKKGYTIDQKRAYYYGDSIAHSSSKNFEIINGYYSKDYQDIYYITYPLNVSSTEDFKFVFKDNSEHDWDRFTTDGMYYYINHYKIPSSDYENIILYKGSGGISSDSKNAYYQDRDIRFRDGKRILDTLDIASFYVSGYLDCGDKFGAINVFHGRE